MIEFEDIKISLSNIESEINELRDSLDIGGKQKQIALLEKRTTDPHIWEDTDKAQKIFQKNLLCAKLWLRTLQ